MRWILAALAALPLYAWAQGSAELSWTPPSQFTDGSPLNPAEDLSGYGIYVDGERVDTAAAGTESYLVEDLGYGSHEFTVTAIRDGGIESMPSNVVAKEIPDSRVPEPPTLLDVLIAWVQWVWGWFV